jgi:N-carbamoyl-L-amino-acid hydrolase
MADGSGGRRALDPARVVEELRELHRLTGDDDGAHRLCWTDTWARARRWFAGKLDGLPVKRHVDPAGNCWVTLRGELDEAVVVGSHLDSVPGGGWLDGTLGVLAGLEVLRAVAGDGRPRRTLKLVDWADEEGSRFGYGMLGSSAVSGTLDVEHARSLTDRDGEALPDVLRRHGVELDRALDARSQIDGVVAYLELHIEQGPVLERMGLPLAAVRGTVGVERHVVTFAGQTAHAGSTPMADRRDSLAAAARLLLAVREQAVAAGGLATVGRAVTRPGIPVAVAGETELIVDQRHLEAEVLAAMLADAGAEASRIAREEGVDVRWSRLWAIHPIAFDPAVIDAVAAAIADLGATAHRMPSGPLHDAAEVARAGVPTAMLFVQSLRGLSHTKEEDTRPADLELAVRAMSLAVDRLLAR